MDLHEIEEQLNRDYARCSIDSRLLQVIRDHVEIMLPVNMRVGRIDVQEGQIMVEVLYVVPVESIYVDFRIDGGDAVVSTRV